VAYDPSQQRMIDLALRMTRNDPRKIQKALLMAMAVESNFRNVPYGHLDSEGVLQQRPSTGWGPASESARRDVRQFLQRARSLVGEGYASGPGSLAQSIQRSAYPSRYGERADQVNAILRGQPHGQAVRGGGGYGGPVGPRPVDPREALLLGISSFREPEDALTQTPLIADALANYRKDMRGYRQAQQSAGFSGGPFVGYGGTAEGAQLMRRLIRMVHKWGGRAGENPFSDPVDPVHTEGSFHYQRFRDRPRTGFDESRLGRGLDVTGVDFNRFLKAALNRFGMGAFQEIFYDPWGQWDSGRYSRSGIGGHGGHIHFSV
jgi:hypothetical protein